MFSKVTLKDSHIQLLCSYLLQMGLYWNVRGIKIKFILKLMWIDSGVQELVYANSYTSRH